MQGITWQVVFLTLGASVLTASASIITTWINQRQQRKIKQLEIEGQARLKARELLFDSYQKRLENTRKSFGGIQETYGGLFGRLMALDRDEREELRDATITLIKVVKEQLVYKLDGLEEELKIQNLHKKHEKDIGFIKESLKSNWENDAIENVEIVFDRFVKTVDCYSSLVDELISKKCEDLFSDYVSTKK